MFVEHADNSITEIPSIPKLVDGLLGFVVRAGDQRWDYLYVEDAANAIYQTAINRDTQGVFNLASGETHAIREIIERVRDLTDPSLRLRFGELPYPPDQQMRLTANIDRLVSATGWRPEVNIEEGLKRTVDWYKHHPRRVK